MYKTSSTHDTKYYQSTKIDIRKCYYLKCFPKKQVLEIYLHNGNLLIIF